MRSNALAAASDLNRHDEGLKGDAPRYARALLVIIGWLWLGPVVLALVFGAMMVGLLFYAIARLFFAVVHRLER
jgi:hypothetical protein